MNTTCRKRLCITCRGLRHDKGHEITVSATHFATQCHCKSVAVVHAEQAIGAAAAPGPPTPAAALDDADAVPSTRTASAEADGVGPVAVAQSSARAAMECSQPRALSVR